MQVPRCDISISQPCLLVGWAFPNEAPLLCRSGTGNQISWYFIHGGSERKRIPVARTLEWDAVPLSLFTSVTDL